MSSLLDLDGESLALACDCGQELEETIGRLKTNPDLVCPACGAILHVNADELARGLEAVEEKLRLLAAAFGGES